ncbi:ABC transporter ATP-binding protein [Pseudomonas sp. 21LCFQ010]|uniref:ABC transporter ATP-binding protein n=1 Tax=Pseudomonas sp. 21LCFQ010 TaxID=2957506 RepID=UPI0020968AC6|nr:ABC transporter ATP-binding protein [Pseudomonas sp. 21LCFQ010]MCO8164178.1 ABC transporter ATP-binding protein [Pseudomonas sp. 21LCFQ010]
MTILVEQVGKAYPKLKGRWHALGTWLGLCKRDQNWIIRNVSFEVGAGESVGIVGVNGAGKSTLLKLITGTAMPTEGQITTTGRIAALLELGMGFHPEFTGRQNVALAGRMQGLEREQIIELMPAIEAFAEIGHYFDEPVRTYSSGMFVRLAFSVATAVRPEVLIVDEALAVGDAYFQHKSFARIRDFREQGTTLLFVSHDPGAIKSLCDRAILLGDHKLLMDGKPDEVLDYYNALIARKEDTALQAQAVNAPYAGRSGNGKARIEELVISSNGKAAHMIDVGAPLTLTLKIKANEPIYDLSLGFMFKDRTGYDIFGTNTWLRGEMRDLGVEAGVEKTITVTIPAMNIGPGSYSLTLALHGGADHIDNNFDWWDKAAVFNVMGNSSYKHFAGVCALDASFSLDR